MLVFKTSAFNRSANPPYYVTHTAQKTGLFEHKLSQASRLCFHKHYRGSQVKRPLTSHYGRQRAARNHSADSTPSPLFTIWISPRVRHNPVWEKDIALTYWHNTRRLPQGSTPLNVTATCGISFIAGPRNWMCRLPLVPGYGVHSPASALSHTAFPPRMLAARIYRFRTLVPQRSPSHDRFLS